MHKLKIALLLFLIVPIVAACTTTKKFELEGTWTSISKDIDANSSYSIIKKIEFESNGLATITYEDEKQVKIGYNFDSKKASNKKLPYKIVSRRAGDLGEIFADPSKAERELNWHTELTIEDAMKDTINYLNHIKTDA